MSSLLRGTRVVESAMLLNGDRLGCLLGDLGADVIKVEAVDGGDYLRDILGELAPRLSPAFVEINRQKRSLALDLRSPAGLEVFWRLIATADVFVDGNAAGACERLGIGYEAQSARNPRLVYCHYSGFGQHGPYSTIPTHGQMMDALAGAFRLEVGDDGLVRRLPRGSSFESTAYGGEGHATGAVYAAFHVAAALFARSTSGSGCLIDVSASDAVIANSWVGATYAVNGSRIVDRSTIPDDELGPKYSFYETSDSRFILFCCTERRFWERFCKAVDRPDLESRHGEGAVDYGASDPGLANELADLFRTRTSDEWVALAARSRIPIGPAITDAAELPSDRHLQDREIFHTGYHPRVGPYTYVGQPAMIHDDPFRVRRPAPDHGEHTLEILAELGYRRDEIEGMLADGVIRAEVPADPSPLSGHPPPGMPT